MKKSYSVKEYVAQEGHQSVERFIKKHSQIFEKRFSKQLNENIEIELRFSSSIEMMDFYNELKFNRVYSVLYTVREQSNKPLCLIVSGKKTLFEYLGSVEPNLLTIGRNLNIDFKVYFTQSYSGSSFKGSVVNGELLSRQCLVEVNQLLPELTLGLLSQIGKNAHEFDLLLTRIITFPTITIR